MIGDESIREPRKRVDRRSAVVNPHEPYPDDTEAMINAVSDIYRLQKHLTNALIVEVALIFLVIVLAVT